MVSVSVLVPEKSLGIGIRKFGLVRKVSVSVSKNLVSDKKSLYRYREIWSRKKVSVLVSENLVSEKRLGIEKIGLGKKSLGIGIGQNFGLVTQY